MSKEYDTYLEEHISGVQKAVEWMGRKEIIPDIPTYAELYRNVSFHDNSKYDRYEYDAYDTYFYGKDGKDEDDISVIDSAFDYAWLDHIHKNPHHWQYWVLIGDDEEPKALMMPMNSVFEMIADWWSFSWKNGNLYEIFDWYDKHKDKMILHKNTRKNVEDILKEIKKALDAEKETENNDA